jgi:hypothetical protein
LRLGELDRWILKETGSVLIRPIENNMGPSGMPDKDPEITVDEYVSTE